MSKTQILLLGFIGFILLLVVMFKASYWQLDIERDLTDRSLQALQKHHLYWAKIDFNQRGRDALLYGQAPSEKASKQAAQIIANTYGVRVVDNQLEINTHSVLIKPKNKIIDEKYQKTDKSINNNEHLQKINTVNNQQSESIASQVNRTEQPQNKLVPYQKENPLRAKIKTCQKRFDIALRHRPIQFNINNSINQNSLPVLRQLFTAALSCPDLRIKIIAHAYQYNSLEDNIQQSILYGQAVAYFFQQGGIPAKRLLIFGAGAEQKRVYDAFNPKTMNIEFQVIELL